MASIGSALACVVGAASSVTTFMLENVGVTWMLTAHVFSIVLYFSWGYIRPHYKGYNIPPFPVKPNLFLGHLHLMWGNLVTTLKGFRHQGGDVFSLDMAGKLLVVISGYDAIKDILIKHTNEAGDRPQDPSSLYLGEDNHGYVTSRGENWREQRSTTMAILRTFGLGKNILAQKIVVEAQAFTDEIARYKGKAVNLRVLCSEVVSNVTCSVIVGDRFEYDDPFFQQMMKNVNYMFTKFPKTGLIETFPIVQYLPGDLVGLKEWAKHVYDMNDNFVKAYINKMKSTFKPSAEPDNFICAYLQEMYSKQKKGEPTHLDDANLISNIKSLFVAGTESTSTTLLWTILYALHHPHVQERVYSEILTHVGTERAPSIEDKSKLKYLDAVIRETHRLASVLHVMMRAASCDFQFRGYTIPKGSDIMLFLTSCHHDAKTWGDPEKFRPERFLDEDGNLRKVDDLIPFSVGKRNCLGEALAKMEIYLFLATLFQRFKIEPEDASGELPPLEPVISLGASPAPFNVRFVARQT